MLSGFFILVLIKDMGFRLYSTENSSSRTSSLVCAFIDDIYTVANLIAGQDDIKVIKIKDYIKKNAVEATDKPFEMSGERKENIVKKHIKYRCHILLRFYF